MAVTGTGTIDDPFVVTTYAELVNTASTVGSYVKVGNDINITDEYPDGDMPSLVVKSVIDGDNKTITNWYAMYTNDSSKNVIIVYNTGVIKNLNLKNVYAMLYSSDAFVSNGNSNDDTYCFENCNISGVILSGRFFEGYHCKYLMKYCSVNLLFKTSAFVYISQGYMKDAEINNCYVKLKSESNYYLFNSEASYAPDLGRDSYYEIDQAAFGMPTAFIFSNCVFDITTNSTFTFNINDSSASPSIINTTKAPNCTPQNKLLGVTAENWLNTEYLASIGFNAG